MKNIFKRTLCAVLILSMLFILPSCGGEKEPTIEIESETESVSAEVEFLDFFAFDGKYVEDGSDADVKGVAAIKIKNNTANAYELMKIEVEAGGNIYNFFVTALMPGMTLTVLEKDKKPVSGDISKKSFTIIESCGYRTEPSLYKDKFSFECFDGIMNLKNISDRDFENDVYVYYKNRDASGCLGGITYRINFGPMKKGALSQHPSAHLSKDSSEVLFITYGE